MAFYYTEGKPIIVSELLCGIYLVYEHTYTFIDSHIYIHARTHNNNNNNNNNNIIIIIIIIIYCNWVVTR